MKSPVYFLKKPWVIAFLLPIFTFACGSFSNFTVSFFFFITVLVLVSSSFLFFPPSKHDIQVIKEQQSQQEDEHGRNSSTQVEDEAKIGFLDMGLPESCSEKEIFGRCSFTSEEESDFDCERYSGEACPSSECSDEESLIEIELPRGIYVGQKGGERGELNFEELSPHLSPVSIYRWSEMNDEENLIEIDISVGSIK